MTDLLFKRMGSTVANQPEYVHIVVKRNLLVILGIGTWVMAQLEINLGVRTVDKLRNLDLL